MPDMQRLEYDMTPIKNNPLPIVWLVGPPGSGRTTQAENLSKNLGFENIQITGLLKDEAIKDTDRGRTIRNALNKTGRRIPDVSYLYLQKQYNTCTIVYILRF